MATYKELLAQRAELEKQIADQRKAELSDAVQRVRAMVAEFGLTSEDVFPTGRASKKTGEASKVAPKYRDPQSGATWTGRGKAPLWISNTPAEERSKFLIAQE